MARRSKAEQDRRALRAQAEADARILFRGLHVGWVVPHDDYIDVKIQRHTDEAVAIATKYNATPGRFGIPIFLAFVEGSSGPGANRSNPFVWP
jgi:hypothetical protein